MNHPAPTTLQAYALGDLPGPAQRLTEAHVLNCSVCRAQVLACRSELVRQVEALPAALPVETVLPPLRRPEVSRAPVLWRPPAVLHWPSLARVGALLLVAGLDWAGLSWAGLGGSGRERAAQQQTAVLAAEQRQVARWLAQPGVRLLSLTDRQRRPSGHLLLLPSREVLFVLPPAPSGQVYQVWVAAHWKRGDPLTPATRSARGLLSAPVGVNDYVCVSLEDARRDMTGQTRPTKLLGWTML
ncbi:hypothetical protein [Deinococcus alpinitundrae]|uniref:hypothetical protein n=1 Tax=Deinococcus alpinitundrae TaxID=468913 RepID=UPI00137AD966|nr:hypothetical protein [Deinococcus alpinitundrae]